MKDKLKPIYSLEYKIEIIRELLRQTMEEQSNFDVNNTDTDIWLWKQAEKVTYITVLDVLNDYLYSVPNKVYNNVLERNLISKGDD